MCAGEIFLPEASGAGNAWVGNRRVIVKGWIEVKKRLGVAGCLGFGADVENGEYDNRLSIGG